MKQSDINDQIFEGDNVIDPMDGERRTISSFGEFSDDGNATVFMTDGGVMGLNEITSDMIRLDGEL